MEMIFLKYTEINLKNKSTLMHENTHNFNLGEDQTNGKYRYKGKVTQSNRYSIDRQYWKVDRLGSSFCMI